MLKFLWVDTETTGLDPKIHDVIQIAGLIEVPGKLGREFNFRVSPLNWVDIDTSALLTNGISIEEMKTFETPSVVHALFKSLLFEFVNPFDPMDKLILCGHNVQFDSNMLREFCNKQGDKYWNSIVTNGHFDLKFLSVAYEIFLNKRIFRSYSLTAICEVLEIKLENAHDAMADIMATRECCLTIWNKIQG